MLTKISGIPLIKNQDKQVKATWLFAALVTILRHILISFDNHQIIVFCPNVWVLAVVNTLKGERFTVVSPIFSKRLHLSDVCIGTKVCSNSWHTFFF